MSYYSEWNKKSEDTSDPKAYEAYIEHYYTLERDAYRVLLADHVGEKTQEQDKSAKEWAETLGFGKEMDIFVGFLEGMQTSVRQPLNLEELTDETTLHFDIDYEKLLYNMHDAKAAWLFNLPEWEQVLSAEDRERIVKEFRKDHIAHSEKIGRNDPCPCGSGKKYKKCHGKNA